MMTLSPRVSHSETKFILHAGRQKLDVLLLKLHTQALSVALWAIFSKIGVLTTMFSVGSQRMEVWWVFMFFSSHVSGNVSSRLRVILNESFAWNSGRIDLFQTESQVVTEAKFLVSRATRRDVFRTTPTSQ